MTANEDLIFLELAHKRELLTSAQVDEVVALQKKLRGMGLTESAADLVEKKGMIPPKDVQLLRMNVSSKGGGQQIEGYRLIERLGRGGMGSVYKATQISMKRPVALKVLKPSLIKDDQQVARLQREAQLVGALQHPNIVRGLDFGVSNGFHYFAMEYVDGRSVKEVVEEDGPFEEAEALRVVREVANALDHAHQEGIVHRDIKPGNILVGKDGAVKLADYGLAKGPLEDMELTKSGVTVGTPQYISPEQAKGPSEVDIRTDLYSLGATLYHMVTGRTPYQGETLAHLIQQVLYEPYAPPQTLRRDLSQEVCFLIEKLMARKPAHRYQSPAELLADLDAIDGNESIVPAGWQGDFEAFHLRKWLKRIVALTIAVLVLGGAGAIYLNIQGMRENERQREIRAGTALSEILGAELSPETLNLRISETEGLIAEYEDLDIREDAEKLLADLLSEREYLERVNELKQENTSKLREEEWADVLEALRKAREEIPEGSLAYEEIGEFRFQVQRRRDTAVVEALRTVRSKFSDSSPADARDALKFVIDRIEQRAYLEDEEDRNEEFKSSGRLLDDLDRAIKALDSLLVKPRALLDVEGERDYLKIKAELDRARSRYDADTPLQARIAGLPAGWRYQLQNSFKVVDDAIVLGNESERDKAFDAANALAKDGKYQAAIDELAELFARSLEPIQGELAAEERRLEDDLRTRRETIGEEWDRFLRSFVEFLSQREHEAAKAEHNAFISNLARIGNLVPNPYQTRLDGALTILELSAKVQNVFLDAVHGKSSIPEGFLFTGVRIAPVYDVARTSDRSFRFATKPGGPAVEKEAKSVRVDDLFREVARTRFNASVEDPMLRSLRGILLWGELLRVRELRKLRDQLPEILALVRSGGVGDPALAPFLEEVYALMEMKSTTVQEDFDKLEREVEKIFRVAEEDFYRRNWQEAINGYKRLLEERVYRETDFVNDREKDIRDRKEEAETHLPSVKMSDILKTRVALVAGKSVESGMVVSIDYEWEDPAQLESLLYDPEWVEIVEVESPRVGPPAPWEAGDPNRTVVEHLLRFEAPAKTLIDPRDKLDRRPLRLKSPLVYSEQMKIEFLARWERPRALVLSLCGTNVVILSDNSRMENGRGVHIFQATDLEDPSRYVPDALRGSVLKRRPDVLAGEALRHRYFQFEPDRWYRIRFVKGEKLASLFVDDRLVLDAEIKQYGAKGDEISIVTYSPMEIDEVRITGTVEKGWYARNTRGR